MPRIRYKETLTQQERQRLEAIATRGRHSSQKILNSLLLSCDEGRFQKRRMTNQAISDPQHGQHATPLDGIGLRVDTRQACPSVTVRPSPGVHPQSGGCVASRTAGWPVIAGISNLVRVEAIVA